MDSPLEADIPLIWVFVDSVFIVLEEVATEGEVSAASLMRWR